MKQTIVTILLAIVALLGGSYAGSSLGSVQDGQGYNATTTPTISSQMLMLKVGAGNIGSVVIGTTSATTFEIRNATSTTDVASTTILQVAASPAIGSTLTLDVDVDRGIALVFPASFTGRYTITYR